MPTGWNSKRTAQLSADSQIMNKQNCCLGSDVGMDGYAAVATKRVTMWYLNLNINIMLELQNHEWSLGVVRTSELLWICMQSG